MLASLQAISDYRQGRSDSLLNEAWLQYIVSAEERIVNFERIRSLEELTRANPVLDYVERSLLILDSLPLSFWMKEIVEEVLVWSEVAKGGTARERIRWQEEGINCFVHNEGSAHIYRNRHEGRQDAKFQLVHKLIETHGLIGQQLRGEVPPEANAPLAELAGDGLVTQTELEQLLLALNRCIIGAVSAGLWEQVETDVKLMIHRIVTRAEGGRESAADRLKKLRAASIRRGEDFGEEFAELAPKAGIHVLEELLRDRTFWYVESALQDFSLEQFLKILALTARTPDLQEVRHISFEHLMSAMYYDYKGVKKINIYKKRIIEKYLEELAWDRIAAGLSDAGNPHLCHRMEKKAHLPDTVFFQFQFSPAADKLIEFCMEAEKSPLYEKAVLLLFDLFGLRRDAYDRFHNEEEYLSTMNQTADYKKVILDYVVGKRVVDIGPGGGVMLDLIEQQLPDKAPIGIDISTNVIEALKRKKQVEGRRWEGIQGDALNLKDYVQPGSIDTVIFSSIIHELYSYVPFNGKKFNSGTVAAALRSAFDVLSPGGRIIIRDGIMTEPVGEKRRIRFLKPDGMPSLVRYAGDFAGRAIEYVRTGDNEVVMPVNDAMEFLYTYTWGEEAYVHEVQEQFGYFTPSEYVAFIRDTLGGTAHLLVNRHYLQEGYTEALADKIVMTDEAGRSVPLPDSTCFIVIEKKDEVRKGRRI